MLFPKQGLLRVYCIVKNNKKTLIRKITLRACKGRLRRLIRTPLNKGRTKSRAGCPKQIWSERLLQPLDGREPVQDGVNYTIRIKE